MPVRGDHPDAVVCAGKLLAGCKADWLLDATLVDCAGFRVSRFKI